MKTKKERNLEYEKKFHSYLFKGDWKRHQQITKNIGVVPSTPATRIAFYGQDEISDKELFDPLKRYTIDKPFIGQPKTKKSDEN